MKDSKYHTYTTSLVSEIANWKRMICKNKPKMAYSRDAFIETREDRETREREKRGTID